jgi:transcriptional regulator GlxA family with amidase domain
MNQGLGGLTCRRALLEEISMKKTGVGILLFDEVELLDFAGPYEVFSTANFPGTGDRAFTVQTLSQKGEIVTSRNGLKVLPDGSMRDGCGGSDAPEFDLLIVPGGYGAEVVEIDNPVLIDWIRSQSERTPTTASVCTGAFLLAQAGLLSGREATTHWKRIEILQKRFPDVRVREGITYVDTGDVVTSGGVAAGIAMSLHLVERYLGRETALETARDMEYHGDF